jgi:uncharacterized RDD family membrane protein YckC
MPRWTGTWLAGPQAAPGELGSAETWPGQRLGLPQEGSGSVAPFGARAAAFAVDAIASGFVASLFVHPSADSAVLVGAAPALIVLALEQVLFVALIGQTLGMRLVGLKVVRLARPEKVPGLLPAVLRTIPLMITLGLAAFFTKDGRGLHDLAAGSVVVRD